MVSITFSLYYPSCKQSYAVDKNNFWVKWIYYDSKIITYIGWVGIHPLPVDNPIQVLKLYCHSYRSKSFEWPQQPWSYPGTLLASLQSSSKMVDVSHGRECPELSSALFDQYHTISLDKYFNFTPAMFECIIIRQLSHSQSNNSVGKSTLNL